MNSKVLKSVKFLADQITLFAYVLEICDWIGIKMDKWTNKQITKKVNAIQLNSPEEQQPKKDNSKKEKPTIK